MVRTIVIRVETGAPRCEQRRYVRMHDLQHRFVEEAAGDARLVRYQNHPEAGAVESADSGNRIWIQLDALRSIQIANLLDEGAVAIEKDRCRCREMAGHRYRRTAVV